MSIIIVRSNLGETLGEHMLWPAYNLEITIVLFFFLNRISSLTNLQHKPKGTFQIHLAFYHNENLLVPFLLVPGVSQ